MGIDAILYTILYYRALIFFDVLKTFLTSAGLSEIEDGSCFTEKMNQEIGVGFKTFNFLLKANSACYKQRIFVSKRMLP